MAAEQLLYFRHLVGIHSVGDDVRGPRGLTHTFGKSVALLFGARRYHYLREYFRMHGAFVRHYRPYASGADDHYFSHVFSISFFTITKLRIFS